MLSVSLTSLSGGVRALLDAAVSSIARDPDAEPGTQADRPFEAVQLDARRQVRAEELGATARRELRHRINERGLKLSGLVFPLRGSVADADRLDARLDALRQAMTLAFELGGRSVILPSGRLPEADSPEADRLAEVLDVLARHGDRCGATLTLRLGSDAAEWAAWLDAVSEAAPVGVQFDAAAAVMAGQGVEEALRAVADRTVQLRLRDAVSESRTAGREVTLGRGEVDFDLLAGLSTELPSRPVLVVDPSDASAAQLRSGVAFARAVFEPSA